MTYVIAEPCIDVKDWQPFVAINAVWLDGGATAVEAALAANG